MKFVANSVNGTYMRDILYEMPTDAEIDCVLAAVAYGGGTSNDDEDLIGHAVANNLRLDLWMRYDHTVPVAVPLLKRLLKHQADNVFTSFVPDRFHPKVIWWQGYGAYIGSANHTDNGWNKNVEAGVFLTEDELASNGMEQELTFFFDYLRNLDVTIPLSADYIAEQEHFQKLNRENFQKARSDRKHPEWEGPIVVAKKNALDRRKESFRIEWLSTLGYLEQIQKQVMDFRPTWLKGDVPAAWQVDQFLHAYYYNRVGEGLRKPYKEYFERNKKDPNAALMVELDWWASQSSAPSQEDTNLYERAPVLRKLLQKDRVLSLTASEFEQICGNTHATVDHISKIPTTALGRPDLASIKLDERIALFAPLLFEKRNRKGWGVQRLLHYVLDGGDARDTWERLYHAGCDPEYRIPRYGLNSLAEVIGWARPEVMPPRNGRTSKALQALGFPVSVYGG